MRKLTIVASNATISAIQSALSERDDLGSFTLTFGANDDADPPAAKRRTAVVELDDNDIDDEPDELPAKRRVMRASVPQVLYQFTKRRTWAQIKQMDLTRHQLLVAKAIMGSKKPLSRDAIAKLTGIGRKSVESPIYVLRTTTPALIKSIPNPAATVE